MTPKEKAKELIDKFRKEFEWVEKDYPIDLYRDTRQCALIAVDEIMRFTVEDTMLTENDDDTHQYWRKVKEEINKI